MKLASAGPSQPAPPVTNTIPARSDVAETSSAVVARAAVAKPDAEQGDARTEMPPQPANFGTGNGILGVLPASSVPAVPRPQAIAAIDSAPAPSQPAERPASPCRGHPHRLDHPGRCARERKRSAAAHRRRPQSGPRPAQQGRSVHRAGRRQGQSKAVPRPLRRLERDQAEAVCRTLKRADISCITVRN